MTNAQGNCGWGATLVAGVLMMLTAVAASAQTFTTLHSFDESDGAHPYAGLIQASDGNLYGTTASGGTGTCILGCGTVFKIISGGTLTTLYSFCPQSGCPDGAGPTAALAQAIDGNFYGTAESGGAYRGGVIFRVTPGGMQTTIYSFCSQGGDYCTDGANPVAGLVQGTDGNFYGTTSNGGTGPFGGTVFKITPSGMLTTLYSFCSQIDCADGSTPDAALVQGTDGNFYGTTFTLGSGPGGTVFKITPNGTLTTLHNFCSEGGCADGEFPNAALVQGIDGSFYGTTVSGGVSNACGNGCGTIFKISPSGTLTTLYSFCSQGGCTDGYSPYAGLIQATDGNFYGATRYGGESSGSCAAGCGRLFKITPSGTLTTLHSFDCTDGANPVADLVQDTNGSLYGTTLISGNCNSIGYGTVFSLSIGLRPFVEPRPTSGKVGAAVEILGTNLTGATSVTFNGTPTTFTVGSKTVMKATVPVGATNGPVQVTIPGGTLKGDLPFRVIP